MITEARKEKLRVRRVGRSYIQIRRGMLFHHRRNVTMHFYFMKRFKVSKVFGMSGMKSFIMWKRAGFKYWRKAKGLRHQQ